MYLPVRLIALAGLATSTAQAAEAPYFRMQIFPSSEQAAPPLDSTDATTGITISIPCSTCRVRSDGTIAFHPTATGIQGEPTWSLAYGQLPPGAALSTADGSLSGAPAALGTSTFALSVTDARGAPATSRSATIQVLAPPSLSYGGSTGLSNRAIRIWPALSSVIGPATYAITAGTLSPGLTFDPASGIISGKVEQTSLGLQVTLTDSDGAAATSAPFNIVNTDQGVIAFDSSTYSARTGVPMAVKPTIIGLKRNARIAVSQGAVPMGMSIEPESGTIQGTPVVPGVSPDIVLAAPDANDAIVTSAPISIMTTQPSVSYAPVGARFGRPYTLVPSVSGLNGPTFSQVAGALPQGLSLSSSDGSITGVPTAAGTFGGLQFLAVDGDLAQATSNTFGIDVLGALAITLAPSDATQSARVGMAATRSAPTVSNASGTPTIALGPVTGAVPGSAAVDASGILTYTPTVPGTWTYALTAADPDGASATSDTGTVTVLAPLQASAGDIAVRAGNTGRSTLTATPATSPAWTLAAGAPAWITPSGSELAASPPVGQAPATYGPYTARVSDADGASASAPFSVVVSRTLAIADGTDVIGSAGQPLVRNPPAVAGAIGTLTYALLQGGADAPSLGALCPGLAFSPATGVISGTPTGACATTLDYRVSDDGNGNPGLAATATDAAPFAIRVSAATVAASPNAPTVTEGDTVAVSATTSLPNPVWTASGQPDWMVFSTAGGTFSASSVSADVSAQSSYPVTLTAAGGGASATQVVTVTVNPATATLAPAATRSGGPFSAALTQTMSAPGSWSASAAPSDVAGLSVSGSTLSGTAPPNAGGAAVTRTLTATYAATAAPSAGGRALASASSTLTVHPALSVAAQAAKSGTAGTPMPFPAPAVNGKVGALTYALLQGAADVSSSLGTVCPGLSFSSATGAVSGTPTGACSANLSYRVSDDGAGNPNLAATASNAPFALSVVAATVTASVPSATVTEGDVVAFSATTDLPSPTWSVSGNPSWMAFSATGGTYATSSVSPDVTAAQTYTVILTANGGGASAQKAVTVTVNPATATLATPSAVRSNGAFSAAVSKTLSAAGAWSASASPADVGGLAVSGTTLSGTAPANPGPSALTRTLTAAYTASAMPASGARATASASATLTVQPALTIATAANQSGSAGNPMSFAAPSVGGKVGALTYAILQGANDVSASLGNVCPGLSFSSATGAVSGTPTGACSANLSYRVSDDGAGNPNLAASATGSPFALNVSAATVTASAPSVSVTEGDAVQLTATTSLPNPTWSASGNPTWMTFAKSGDAYVASSVSPDVTSTQSYSVTLTASAGGASAAQTVTVSVAPASAGLATPAPVRAGASFTAAVSETMAAPGAWSASASPADVGGLAVSGTNLTGTAPANGTGGPITRSLAVTYTASAAPTAGARATATAGATLTVQPALTLAAPANQSGTAGTAMSFAAPSVGGKVGGLSYSLFQGATDVSGSLGSICGGLAFAKSTGTVSGTPTGACSATLSYRVADDGGSNPATLAAVASSPAFALSVAAATATASVPSVSVTEGDAIAFSATTNLPGATWSASGNPSWMTFSNSGGTFATSVVSADVASTQTYPVTLTATNGSGASAATTVSVTVYPATVSVPAVSARSGKAFSAQVSTSLGAAGPWSASASPADVGGLSISGTTLSGTAPVNTGGGNIARTLYATRTASSAPAGGAAATASGSGTLTVFPGVSMGAPAAASGSVGLQMAFGPPPVANLVGTATYALTQNGADVSGSLGQICPGLSFSTASGTVSGIPTSTCSATLAYAVTDNGGGDPNMTSSATSATFPLAVAANYVTASKNYASYIEGDPMDFFAYSATQWSTWKESGNPGWMSFKGSFGRDDPNNAFAADIDATQVYNVTITGTDFRAGTTGSVTIVVTIDPATTTLTPAAVRSGGGFSMAASSTMRASATWSATASPDVTGLAFSGSTLSGTAPANGGAAAITRTVTATRTASTPPTTGSQYSAKASGGATLTVYPYLSIANQSARSGRIGAAVSFGPPAVIGQAGALRYALKRSGGDVSGSLGGICPGLSFSTATGLISGTPTAACSAVLDYAVTDDGSGNAALAATANDTAGFTLSVTP